MTVACSLCVGTAQATATDDLPDFGGPWGTGLSLDDEYQIGRMVMHRLREAGELLEDPELTEYLQSIGHRLSVHAHDGRYRFEFFLMRDPIINAFALPGGFIGINAGLILATQNESELAGVLAHEIAHVTQRHIARMVQSSSQTGLAATAAMMAAILLGAATGMGADAVQAAIAVAQGMAVQNAITHTREHEYEADRVGVGILADAGFDPRGMPSFFETLARRSGSLKGQVPEFLLTHPVESARIAETRGRAETYGEVESDESRSYGLMRARLQVLTASTPGDAIEDFVALAGGDIIEAPDELRYGYATALLQAGQPERAIVFFESLLRNNDDVIAYHTGLAQALLAAGKTDEALATFAHAVKLFPRNVPLTIRYSRALMDVGKPTLAHTLLFDLLNNIQYTADQVHLIALAANAAGDTADAHYYMSEFHVLNGELPLAVHQLEMALATPHLEAVQRARFQARMDEIKKYLPEKRRRRAGEESEVPGPSFTPSGPGAHGRAAR